MVRAPGLTFEQAVRGDLAAHLSDLIAEGSFAPLADPPDLPGLEARLGGDGVAFVSLPCADLAAFDAALGGLREKAAASGSVLAVVSESVLVSQRPLPGIRPGGRVSAADLPRFLAAARG